MQQDLFQDVEKTDVTVALQITTKKNVPLTKLEKDFNKLVKEIENLEKKFESETLKLEKLLPFYSLEISPFKQKQIELSHQFICELHTLPSRFTLSKKAKDLASVVILELLENQFSITEQTDELIAIHDFWSEITFEESLKLQKSMEREVFSDFMQNMFDIELDEENLDIEDPETQQRINEQINEKQAKTSKFQANRLNTSTTRL